MEGKKPTAAGSFAGKGSRARRGTEAAIWGRDLGATEELTAATCNGRRRNRGGSDGRVATELQRPSLAARREWRRAMVQKRLRQRLTAASRDETRRLDRGREVRGVEQIGSDDGATMEVVSGGGSRWGLQFTEGFI
ncbi:alpha-amylase [Sesbania bispinosa]|nr:alpha-amylase [Sesbania bispinosa]